MKKKTILIIGAGASGSAAAWNLSKLGNLNIICFEQGIFNDPDEYDYLSDKWEINRVTKYQKDPNARQSIFDYPINNKNSIISLSNFNGVGGSTVIYNAHLPRFKPSDFITRSQDKVGMNWPINYIDLIKFYELNEMQMGVAGLKKDPSYPEIKNLLPPVKLDESGELILKAFRKLKWHCWPSYSAIATKKIKGRKKLSKANAINSYLSEAISNGVRLKTYSKVFKLETNKEKKVTGVYYFDKFNKVKFQEASIIILACSGAGSPRLLLNSKSKFFPNGLANSSNQVGKNLMLHPLGYVEGKFNKFLASHRGPEGCCLYSHEFYNTNKKNNFKRGYTIQVLRGQSALDVAFNEKKFNVLNFGSKFHETFFDNYGHSIPMVVICEDFPDKKNYLELDYKNKDINGIPGIKVNYTLSNNSKKMLSHGINRCTEVLKKAGAVQIRSFGPVRDTGWHIMGTARMGLNEKNSVVNKYCQTHDLHNLFIVDSSVFTTSSGVNPLNTIMALSLRATDFIKKNINKY